MKANKILEHIVFAREKAEANRKDILARGDVEQAKQALVENTDQRMALWDVVARVQHNDNSKNRSAHVDRLVRERDQALSDIDGKRVQNNEQIRKREAILHELRSRDEDIRADQSNAERHFYSLLERDVNYAELADQASELSSRLEDLRIRHDLAKQERDKKLPDYTNDPLFSHLLNRGFDTPAYDPPLGVRGLDRFIARTCSYSHHIQNYKLLEKMPVWLAEQIDQTQAAYTQAEDERRAFEERARKEHDIASVDLIREENQKRIAKVRQEIDKLKQLGEQLDEDRALFNERRDRHSEQIRQVYMTIFGAMTMTQMIERARETASTEDEKAILEIQDLEAKQPGLERKVQVAQERLQEQDREIARLTKVIDELNESGKMTARYEADVPPERLDALVEARVTTPAFVGEILNNLRVRSTTDSSSTGKPTGGFGGLAAIDPATLGSNTNSSTINASSDAGGSAGCDAGASGF